MTLILQVTTWLSFAALILVASCETRTPLFWPMPEQKYEIKGVHFEVRPLRQSAGAVGIKGLCFPKLDTVLLLTLAAIRSLTSFGKITSLAVDPSVIIARLDCLLMQVS